MKKKAFEISRIASLILSVGLPIIAVYFVYIVISVISSTNTSPSVLVHTYSPQLEHIVMSLTLIIIGAVLMDISEKEIK